MGWSARSGAQSPSVVVALAALALMLALAEVVAYRAAGPPDPTRASRPVPASDLLLEVDQALAARDVAGALRAWRRANVVATGSRRWEAVLAVGDAYLRIGDAADIRRAFAGRAREVYLTALFLAREERSVEGVLRAAEAFAALGDRDVADHSLSVARRIADETRDRTAQARVAAAAARLMEQVR